MPRPPIPCTSIGGRHLFSYGEDEIDSLFLRFEGEFTVLI